MSVADLAGFAPLLVPVGAAETPLDDAVRLARAADVRVEPLSATAVLWGKEVDDERYAVVATV